MRLHEQFEWDDAKAASNQRKHGVTFDDAAIVLHDEDGSVLHIEVYDSRSRHEAEDRWATTASSPLNRSVVLVMVWTDRSTERQSITRIISARRASKRERQAYEKTILLRKNDPNSWQ